MLKLMKHLRGSMIFAIIAPLFMLLEVFMDLMQPTLLKNIIDVGVANGDIQYILNTGLQMIGFALLGVIGGAGCTVFSSIASMNFGTSLRDDMYRHIQTLSFAEIDRFKTSSLVTRMTNDVTQVQNTVMMLLRVAVRSPLLCIGGIIMALIVSPRLSMILIVAVPVLAVAVVLIVRRAFPLFGQMQVKIDRVNTVMRENLLGVRVVKAFDAGEQEQKRFGVANDDLMAFSIKAQRIIMTLWPVVMLIMNFSIVAVLWFGGASAIAGEVSTGDMMSFMNYILQVLNSIMMSIMLIIGFSRARASAERINEVLDTHSSIVDPAVPRTPERFDVQFDHVSFKFDPSDPDCVLNDLSFAASPGQTVGIIGGTGSGKSSLISLIPRLYDVSDGAVRIGGVDVRDIPLEDLRRHIGIVMQESTLFSGTVEENIRWGGEDASPEQFESALRDAEAYGFVHELPDGADGYVEQRGQNFSGGQKQRLSIARTLIKDPRILILDDSTSAVDMATEARIQAALKRRGGDDTVVFIIAQRISAISDASKILVLDDGRIVAQGTHAELLQTCEIYRSIAVSQLGEEALLHVR